MRPGFALTTHRFAAFPLRTAIDTAGEITRPLTQRPILALVAGIFFAAVLAAQAQEPVEPDVLPSLAEPPPASAESLPSTSAEPLPALPQSLPSTPAEPLPSSEQAFPSSPEPLSSSTNYTTAQTNVIAPPTATGPYGGFDNKNVFPGGQTT